MQQPGVKFVGIKSTSPASDINAAPPAGGADEDANHAFDRHPIMTGVLIGIWVTPTMTLDHLLFASGSTVYVCIGIHFEERSLQRQWDMCTTSTVSASERSSPRSRVGVRSRCSAQHQTRCAAGSHRERQVRERSWHEQQTFVRPTIRGGAIRARVWLQFT